MFEKKTNIGGGRVKGWMKEHVGSHEKALPVVLNAYADMTRRVPGQIDGPDTARNLPLTVDRLHCSLG